MAGDWPLPDGGDLIVKRHRTEDSESLAVYSPCETYRYGLARRWSDAPPVLFVMLNPSTATELRNDPTIERCERRARALGLGGVMIANLFAYRATQPKDLKAASAPVGPENDRLLMLWHDHAALTIAAWGVHGAHQNRCADIQAALKGPLHHLGLTKAGHPRHPLYVSYKTQPMEWSQTDERPDSA